MLHKMLKKNKEKRLIELPCSGESLGLPLSPPPPPRPSQWLSGIKNLPAVQEMQVQSVGQEEPQRRAWQPTPALLPGESHGQRSLVGCSPWGPKEADTTEVTSHTCRHGTPLILFIRLTSALCHLKINQ